MTKKRIKLVVNIFKGDDSITDTMHFFKDYYDRGEVKVGNKAYRNISVRKYMRVRNYSGGIVVRYFNSIKNIYFFGESRVYGINTNHIGWSDD